jgi:site-specific recombinase XerD
MSKFLDSLKDKIRVKHYSYKTEKTYTDWAEKFIRFHGLRHPETMGRDEVAAYITHLAVDKNYSGATQDQALHALLFMYEHVVGVKLEHIDFLRSKKSKRIPDVLTQDEVKKILGRLRGVYYIIVRATEQDRKQIGILNLIEEMGSLERELSKRSALYPVYRFAKFPKVENED